MRGFLQSFRQSFRRILNTPGFTLVVALTLALGIGANAAILSVVNGVLLKPLPYENPDGLVTIYHHYPSLNDLKAPVSAAGFERYHERNNVFDGLAVRSGRSYTLTGRGEAERLSVDRVSGEYFQVMGVPAALGRYLEPSDDQLGSDRVVVLTHGFWQRAFGGDASAIGEKIVLDGESYDIVGVMPAEFRSFFNRGVELWKPLALTAEQMSAGNEYLAVVARLKPEMNLEQAEADLAMLTRGIQEEFPDGYPPDWGLLVVTLNEIARGDIRPALMLLAGAVGLVLMIACANVANLFLARSASRQREMAVYQALGASRSQVIGQVLTESLILAALGGVAGLILAYFGMKIFVAATVARFADKVVFDATVVGLTTAVTMLAALIAGVAPALLSTGHNLVEPLREGGRGLAWDRKGQILRRSLIVAEMALALVLLVGSGLLVRSFLAIQDVHPGFRSDHLLTANVALPASKYGDASQQLAFFDELLERVQALPGVTAAGGTSVLPFGGNWSTTSFQVEGYEAPPNTPGPWGDVRMVTPDFLTALGAPLQVGRLLAPSDGPESPRVALIDSEFARRYYPDQDPIGKRLAFGFSDDDFFNIVGVVGHTMHEGLDADARIQVYLPFSQFPRGGISLGVRTDGEPLQATAGLRHILRSMDSDVPLSDVKTMQQRVAESLGSRRFTMLLLGVFSALALLLSAVGIYGVMSYAVTQRTREMGLRLALGAAPGSVLGLVLRQGLTLALIGAAVGLAGAFALTRLMASQLFGVGATDLPTFLGVPLVLLASAGLATWIPAWRATRLDPAVVLREE